MKCSLTLAVLLLIVTCLWSQVPYPPTAKQHQEDVYHGEKIADPYRWLENDTSPITRDWVNEQSKFTEAYLEAIPFRHAVRKRVAELYNYPRYSSPFRKGSWYYFYKNDGLQNYPVLYRQSTFDSTAEEVIDPNKLSPDGSVQLTQFVPSKNGRYAAYMFSHAGSDWQTIRVKDLTTMTDLADSIRWVKQSDIAWQDNGFYYSRYPEPRKGAELVSRNENQQLWFHHIGTSQESDSLIFEDKLHPFRFYYASTSDDERFVFLSIMERNSKGASGNALWFLDNNSEEKRFRPIVEQPGEFIYGVVDPVGDRLLVQTNEHAPNGKVILFDPARPGHQYWKTIIPEKPEPLELATMGGGRLFAKYLRDVASRVYVYDSAGNYIHEIELPGVGEAEVFRAAPEDTVVFYTYRSLNYPTHVFQYHIGKRTSSIFRKPPLLFNPEDYITARRFVQSRDGTRIPLFMVHKKNLRRSGANPTLMVGYGGFNYTFGLPFNPSVMAWLEQGGIYVIVGLRGGGEYGEAWHKAGMLHNKQRVFDDFISAAEFLVRRKFTSPRYLAIRGASNGGLLVGAVTNQRPDLFRVAVPEMGVMDMLRFQKFTIGWNWIAEYGSSDNENDFRNLLSYSPIHNIRSGVNYPAVLVVTADHDDRVVPAHSFKYLATLQEKYKGPNPVLLKVETNSGHGLSSIMKNIELASDIYTFILFNMGVEWKETENTTVTNSNK